MIIPLLLVPLAVAAQRSAEDAERELEEVRQRIEALQDERASEGRELSKAEQELARAEKAEQKVRRELSALQGRLRDTRKRMSELEASIAKQETELARQQAMLDQQLRAAWISGQEEWLKLVLSQKDPAALGRRLTWYRYLTQERGEVIAGVREQLDGLARDSAVLDEEAERLAALEADQSEVLDELGATRRERKEQVAAINANIETRDEEIARLKQQESELADLVAELARTLPTMPALDAGPFSKQKGRLGWPVAGSLRNKFGQSRADGRMKWNGVLVAAPAGEEVHAVYHGRVVFADWLTGMGLLLILEHGEGYLSLYGHNQDLIRDVGEWVEPGEIIAHVGDSGGQASAGLYFELRHNGEPVNPAPWMR